MGSRVVEKLRFWNFVPQPITCPVLLNSGPELDKILIKPNEVQNPVKEQRIGIANNQPWSPFERGTFAVDKMKSQGGH